MLIGERIKEVRKSLGISQAQLAKMAGIAQSAVSYIESTAQKPNTETIALIAKAMNISQSYLLGEEESTDDYITPDIHALIETARLLPPKKIAVLVETAKAML